MPRSRNFSVIRQLMGLCLNGALRPYLSDDLRRTVAAADANLVWRGALTLANNRRPERLLLL
jgi:hypothetical protein